jgi:hypothetical protein
MQTEWGDAQKRARAEEFAKEGLLSKACSALVSEPPVAVDNKVVNQMRSKHPGPRPMDEARCKNLREISPAAAVQVTAEDVGKAVRGFPRVSAPGPSGLRPQHLKDAMAAGWADEVLRELTAVVNKMAKGNVPDNAQEYVTGANLTALPKPNDEGLRPVAVGECLRRCVAKSLWQQVKADVTSRLEPV